MSITPVQSNSALLEGQSIARSTPKGLAAVPDRLESPQVRKEDAPPSLFKKILFDPAVASVKWLLRGIFHFIDWLKGFAFEEESSTFLSNLRTAPRTQEILFQFEQCFHEYERNEIYRSIGEGYEGRLSWKERIWSRSAQQNIELGKLLVEDNPERIRDHLVDRLALLGL